MNKDIRISIVLPNYNSEKFLEKCLASFVEQDYENKELIIVEGKSTDASHAIIELFCNLNSTVKWIKEIDTCVTDGFSIGVRFCTGAIIGFLASDSVYYTNDIFKIINENFNKVRFDCIYFNAYSYFVNASQSKILLRDCSHSSERDTLLKVGCFIPFETYLFSS